MPKVYSAEQFLDCIAAIEAAIKEGNVPDDALPIHSVVWRPDHLPPEAVVVSIRRRNREVIISSYAWPEIDDGSPGVKKFECRPKRLKADRPQAPLANEAARNLAAFLSTYKGEAVAVPPKLRYDGGIELYRRLATPDKPYHVVGGAGVVVGRFNPFGGSWPISSSSTKIR